MADKQDYYEVLGLKKGASDDDIKKAYRRIAKECHPDLHPGDKAAETRFKQANEAYAVLSDPDKRSRYDQFGFAGVDPNYDTGGGFTGDFGDLGDIFGDIFSAFGGGFGGASGRTQNRGSARRGESLRVRLAIAFEEAAFGCKKDVTISRVEQCPDCKGSGCEPGTTAEVCPDCKGSGTVRTSQRTAFGMFQTTGACPKCRGSGRIIHSTCSNCRGSGTIRVQRTLNVSIPAGIDNGETVSLRGQGNAGAAGSPSGDLLITVQVRPSSVFEREGNNIYVTTRLSFVEAALGTQIEVPTLDGAVSVNIPAGTQPGSAFRLRGKGVPNVRGGGRGDQYVTVELETPRNLTARQKELLREFLDPGGTAGAGEEKSAPKGRKKRK